MVFTDTPSGKGDMADRFCFGSFDRFQAMAGDGCGLNCSNPYFGYGASFEYIKDGHPSRRFQFADSGRTW